MKTQASSPAAVAPLQTTLPSQIPKRQSQGAQEGDENYGAVGFF